MRLHAVRATVRGKSALATLLLAAGCGGDGGRSAWTAAVETSGGVRRVVNTPPPAGAQPTLAAAEEWRIGIVEGEGPTSFGMIRSVAVLPDGRIAVADGQAEEVRLFAPDGQYLRTFGGRGSGPGELRGMQGVHVDHEGMLRVAEQGNARLSVFHPDQGFVTSWPLRLFSFSFRGPWGAAIDADGRTFVASSGQFGEGRFWRMLRVYDPPMNQLDSIPYDEYTGDLDGDMPGAWRVNLGAGSWSWAPVPFYSSTREVLTPTGEFWSSREGTAQLEIARWTPPADTSLVLTSRRRPDPVTAAERDSAMHELREQLATRVATPPRLDASRVPATRPPLYGLSLDDDGRLWVRLSEPTADTTAYDVFGRDGRHAETVWVPFRVDAYVPPVVRGDTLWAVVLDELDVQYVVRARLRAPDRT
jgi:hypothetical protein